MFPAGSATPRDIDSSKLLRAVVDRLDEARWRPTGVDLTIIGARPKLAVWLDPMRDAIATVLGITREAVSVKASTGNLEGAEGAGRAIWALALATIEAIR